MARVTRPLHCIQHMKPLYALVKFWMRVILLLYFKKIEIRNEHLVPDKGAIMFLPNHQNALLDPLIIAAFGKRKPYFLTRSDVFTNPVLRYLFNYFQMIPVYRLRDGRQQLKNNEAVFERCSSLLLKNGSILLFPEANHNLLRRVRPLSKGFTRIVNRALEKEATLDLYLVPTGINYRNAAGFPDAVSIVFGQPISVQEVLRESVELPLDIQLKKLVYEHLQKLTTDIPQDADYTEIHAKLVKAGVDFLQPSKVNEKIGLIRSGREQAISGVKIKTSNSLWNYIFRILNWPVLLPWKWIKKNKIPEPEFVSTYRFVYSLLSYPLFYILLFTGVAVFFGILNGLYVISLHFIYNLVFVKFSNSI